MDALIRQIKGQTDDGALGSDTVGVVCLARYLLENGAGFVGGFGDERDGDADADDDAAGKEEEVLAFAGALRDELKRLKADFADVGAMFCPADLAPEDTVAALKVNTVRDILLERKREQGRGEGGEEEGEDFYELTEAGKPIDEKTRYLFAMCHPHLFPTGNGDCNDERPSPISQAGWAEWVMLQADMSPAKDAIFLFTSSTSLGVVKLGRTHGPSLIR